MRRSLAYLILTIAVISLIGTLAIAKLSTIYDPIAKRNVPIDRVSIDDIKAWASTPQFKRWNNMDALEEWLDAQGIDIDDILEESAGLSKREKLVLTHRNRIIRRLTPLSSSAGNALHDIECNLADKELEFKITNLGKHNWFLVNQGFTTGSALGRKTLSDALVQAKTIKLFINNFPVNSALPKFWMGEKLFYGHGETFADACEADFVRTGKTVECEVQPIPLRTGPLMNRYLLLTPSFSEQGQFFCD